MSLLLGLLSLAGGSEKLAWVAYGFAITSSICLGISCVADPGSFGRRSEKAAVLLLGLQAGVGFLVVGEALRAIDDEETRRIGGTTKSVGFLFVVLLPIMFYRTTSMLSRLTKSKLSQAVTGNFRGVMFALTSSLYISSTSLRCILETDNTLPVVKQCGNPIQPAYFISLIICFS